MNERHELPCAPVEREARREEVLADVHESQPVHNVVNIRERLEQLEREAMEPPANPAFAELVHDTLVALDRLTRERDEDRRVFGEAVVLLTVMGVSGGGTLLNAVREAAKNYQTMQQSILYEQNRSAEYRKRAEHADAARAASARELAELQAENEKLRAAVQGLGAEYLARGGIAEILKAQGLPVSHRAESTHEP